MQAGRNFWLALPHADVQYFPGPGPVQQILRLGTAIAAAEEPGEGWQTDRSGSGFGAQAQKAGQDGSGVARFGWLISPYAATF